MLESKIIASIAIELRQYFHAMSEAEIQYSIRNYRSVKDKIHKAQAMSARSHPPVDYNQTIIEKFGTRQKAVKAITQLVQNSAVNRFGLISEKRIEDTPFLIDLYDEQENVCYEIALGDGTEVWKDILKALIINAEKLIIFCRSYPNP